MISLPFRDSSYGFHQASSTVESPRLSQRSQSRNVSYRKWPIKAVARKYNRWPHVAHEDSVVRVFSLTAGEWGDANIVEEFQEDQCVRVEYGVGRYWCGKTLHIHSEHILIPSCLRTVVTPFSYGSDGDEINQPELRELAPSMQCQRLIQGCRTILPAAPELFYLELDHIWKLLANEDAILLKGSWLLKCYEQGTTLPRRQEVPREAIWTIAELKERKESEISFVSISHCWYTREHPDPDGLQVQQLGPFLQATLVKGGTFEKKFDLAVFWCYCSFFQEPRTAEEEVIFERSMEHMDLWYMNRKFEVWMLTYVPANVENSAPYEDRGWTTWERSVAMFFSDFGNSDDVRAPLDLARLDPREIEKGLRDSGNWLQSPFWYEDLKQKCKLESYGVPLEPRAFAELISKKYVTKGRADLSRVVKNYQRNFDEVMSVIQHFSFENIQTFGAVQMDRLCSLLPRTKQLRSIKIYRCPVGDAEVRKLAVVLRTLPPPKQPPHTVHSGAERWPPRKPLAEPPLPPCVGAQLLNTSQAERSQPRLYVVVDSPYKFTPETISVIRNLRQDRPHIFWL